MKGLASEDDACEDSSESEPKSELDARAAERPLTHYEVLNVDKGASDDDVRAAYKASCLRCHPDKPGGSTAAFQRLGEAWVVLCDPRRRMAYDAFLVFGPDL